MAIASIINTLHTCRRAALALTLFCISFFISQGRQHQPTGRHTMVTALPGIYLLLFTMQQVLRWKYGLTTLGHKIIQNKCSMDILNFLKNKILIYARSFFVCVFLLILLFCQFDIKNNFKTWYGFILAKCVQQRQQMHPQWGPDTHNNPHQRAEEREKHFKNYQKLLNLWLD